MKIKTLYNKIVNLFYDITNPDRKELIKEEFFDQLCFFVISHEYADFENDQKASEAWAAFTDAAHWWLHLRENVKDEIELLKNSKNRESHRLAEEKERRIEKQDKVHMTEVIQYIEYLSD